jgi:peptidoglycan hydrolase-like protein with peptidoglycan-binding domain
MKKFISGSIITLLIVPGAAFAEMGGNSPKSDEIQKKFQEIQARIHAFKANATSTGGPGSATTTDGQKLTGIENAMQHIRATLERLSAMGVTPPGLSNALSRLQCIALHRNLQRGHQGDDVRNLQKKLIEDGDLEADNDTGFFGPKTEKALQKWQAKHGIVTAGTPGGTGFGAVGPRTRAKLSECFGKPPGGNGTTTPPVTDAVAPVISNVAVSAISPTSATVSWATNEAAAGKLYFSTSTPVMFTESYVATSGTSHSVQLTGLLETTTYYYAIEVKDAANNTATTSTAYFSTN